MVMKLRDINDWQQPCRFESVPSYGAFSISQSPSPRASYEKENELCSMEFPRPSFYEASTASYEDVPLQKLGMCDVAGWLKSLRLHKYTSLFHTLTYDEMLALDEAQLAERGVTRGARRKIAHCVEKLRARPALLRALEQVRRQSTSTALQSLYLGPFLRCVNCAVACLRHILGTPIRPWRGATPHAYDVRCTDVDDKNIPELIFRLVRVTHYLVFEGGLAANEEIEDEYLCMMFQVYDKILSSEAFTALQKNRIYDMKRQARNFCTTPDVRRFRLTVPQNPQCEFCAKENPDASFLTLRRIGVKDYFSFQKRVITHQRQQIYQLSSNYQKITFALIQQHMTQHVQDLLGHAWLNSFTTSLSLLSLQSSAPTSPPAPMVTPAPAPTPTQLPTRKKGVPLYQRGRAQNRTPSFDASEMQIGTWSGVEAERELETWRNPVPRDAFLTSPECQSSGYSSSSGGEKDYRFTPLERPRHGALLLSNVPACWVD